MANNTTERRIADNNIIERNQVKFKWSKWYLLAEYKKRQ